MTIETWTIVGVIATVLGTLIAAYQVLPRRRAKQEKMERRQALTRGLQAAKSLQTIRPEQFAQRLNNPDDLPLAEMEAVETLFLLKPYIQDPDCHQHLGVLCGVFDTVRREKSRVRINEKDVASRVKTLQGRIQWFVDDARAEISSR